MGQGVKTCSKEKCGKKAVARKLCINHYQEWCAHQPGEKGKLHRFRAALRQAKGSKKDWKLSFEDFCRLSELPCTYCQAEPFPNRGSWLDRVDCGAGYELENVVPCCGFCNRLKNKFLSKDEMIAVVELIKTMRGSVLWNQG